MNFKEIKKIATFYGLYTKRSKGNQVIANRNGEYVSVYRNYDELNFYLYDTNKLTYENTKNLLIRR